MHEYFVFDFDSTLVQVETLEILAQLACAGSPFRRSILSRIRSITSQGMRGSISFADSLSRRLALMTLRKEHIAEAGRILLKSISRSVVRRKKEIARASGRIYVVSGGFRECILPVTNELGIQDDHVFANTFTWSSDDVVDGFDSSNPLCDTGGKVRVVAQLALPGNVIGVGDGYTDYEMKAAGVVTHFLAYTENVCRKEVVALADATIDSFEKLPLDK